MRIRLTLNVDFDERPDCMKDAIAKSLEAIARSVPDLAYIPDHDTGAIRAHDAVMIADRSLTPITFDLAVRHVGWVVSCTHRPVGQPEATVYLTPEMKITGDWDNALRTDKGSAEMLARTWAKAESAPWEATELP